MNLRFWFLALVAAAILFLAKNFREQQLSTKVARTPEGDITLTERDKTYLDRYMDLTKWLTGISYAVLAGVAAKRISAPEDKRFVSFWCLLGILLLILSLFAGFLCYESILIVMASEPLWKLRSALTSNPVTAQLWLLALGTASLGFTFFRTERDSQKETDDPEVMPPLAALIIAAVLSGLLVDPKMVQAQQQQQDDFNATMSCVRQWEKSRGIVHTQFEETRVIEETNLVIRAFQSIAPHKQPVGCLYVDAVLDKVRSDTDTYVVGQAEVLVTGTNNKRITEKGGGLNGSMQHYLIWRWC